MSFRLSVFPLILLAVSNGQALMAAGKLQFNRDVRPILSDKCFHCHGPDSKKREGDLRLDERAAAVKEGHIAPGQPEKSLILKRIQSHDPDGMMPPPESKLGSLSPAEIKTLTQWIQEGAEYEAHWSFISLKADAAKNTGIDKIVEAALSEHGLKLQLEAEASALLRRLSFDLTGLPPTAADVLAFSKERYEQTVDQLLASPQYGERMAVDWLDIGAKAQHCLKQFWAMTKVKRVKRW